MTARAELAADFLARAGWGAAARQPLKGDASSRSYTRLDHNGLRAILMDQPPGAETAACPPDATPEARAQLGYNALARLAGPDVRPFAAIATHLRGLGLSAPEILAADTRNGFLLLEDLGDDLFARAIAAGEEALPLYAQAIDVLGALHRRPAPHSLSFGEAWSAPFLRYDAPAMLAETELLLDWFFPAALDVVPSAEQRAEWRGLWLAALAPALATPDVMVLRDYHAANLLWLPARAGVRRVGLLDFQDGLKGPAAYDLISLTEDARRDVAPELAAAMTERYVALRRTEDPAFDGDAFRASAAVLAAQRNVKIVGIFTRLWKRDGKPRYPGYHPRLWRYLARDLSHPALGALKRWFDRHIPEDRRTVLARVAEGAA